MEALNLDMRLIAILNKLFSEVKNRTGINTSERMEINTIIGNGELNIVLADDDDDDVDFFSEAAHAISKNIKITRAKDGIELIKLLENGSYHPDLIFLDLNMPCKNGFECLDTIKKSSAWSSIPVLIYSTSAYMEQLNNTYKQGANLYIKKPHDFSEIKRILKKIFSINISDLLQQPPKEKFLFY